PGDDSEFSMPGNQGEQRHVDLLTVLEHEIGHVLRREHEADGVMAETLTAGTRRKVIQGGKAVGRTNIPRAAADVLFSVLPADAEASWIGGGLLGRGPASGETAHGR